MYVPVVEYIDRIEYRTEYVDRAHTEYVYIEPSKDSTSTPETAPTESTGTTKPSEPTETTTGSTPTTTPVQQSPTTPAQALTTPRLACGDAVIDVSWGIPMLAQGRKRRSNALKRYRLYTAC